MKTLSAELSWAPDSWHRKKAEQQPVYDDAELFTSCMATLSRKPPLVTPGEVERLRAELAEAAAGQRFVLQGGDCSEKFKDCTAKAVLRKLQLLLQISLLLTGAIQKPVTRIGRLAGQYAKPQNETGQTSGKAIQAYRGDMVNSLEQETALRRPDPRRMLDGYHHATASLNYIRALIEGGFADLRSMEKWDIVFSGESEDGKAYRKMVDSIVKAFDMLEPFGMAPASEKVQRMNFYTSHEALLLPYEEALTRYDAQKKAYNLGAHFLWLGYRTGNPDGAHVEYLRGIANPLGIKVGTGLKPDTLLELLDVLNPAAVPGKITLITRFGADNIAGELPRMIKAVRKSGHSVLWCCDPMHGNTEYDAAGRKVRRLANIFSEIEHTIAIHQEQGTFLGGIHIEFTSDKVIECLGGNCPAGECIPSEHQDAECDPRLNGDQTLQMAFLLARLLCGSK